VAGESTVVVKFLGDVDDLAKKTEGVGGKIKGAALGIGAAIGGAFAVDKVMDFVGAAEDAEKASDRLSKVLENAGDATGDWSRHAENLATTLMNSTGIDDEVIKGGQAILATFHNVSGAAGQQSGAFDRATKAALDMSATGFGSVESASTMLGKALEDPVKGITALGKAGVTFSDDQKKAIQAMVDSGDKAGAMNLILQNVEGQVGGVAEASATAGDKMSVAWGDTQEAIGGLLLPAFQRLTPFIQDAAKWVQERLVPAISDLVGWISEHREEIGSYLTPFVDAVKKVVPVILSLARTIGEKLQPVFVWLGDWVSKHKDIFPAIGIAIATILVPAFIAWAINAAIAAASTLLALAPLILIGAAVTALAYLIIANWDTIKAVTAAVWDAIVGFIKGAWQWVVDHWPLLLTILTGPIGAAVAIIVTYWDQIMAGVRAVFDWIRNTFVTVGQWIIYPFQTAWDWIRQVPGWITGAFWGVVSWMQTTFQTVKDAITGPFKAAWEWIDTWVIGPIKSGIQGAVDVVKSAFRGVANIWNSTVGALSFSIPDWVPGVGGKGFDMPDIPTTGLWRGGVVTGPTLAMIGERGPEAVIPLSRAGMGTTVIVNVTTSGLGADAPAIQRGVVEALRHYTARNGPIAGIAG
jgi:phage-related protein